MKTDLSDAQPKVKKFPAGEKMRSARTCYDHMAGRVGMAVADALIWEGHLDANGDSFALTEGGERFLVDLGVDVAGAKIRKRGFSLKCLDWSERRPHLAGALGAAILDRFLADGWIERADGRTMQVTDAGARGLAGTYGAVWPPIGE